MSLLSRVRGLLEINSTEKTIDQIGGLEVQAHQIREATANFPIYSNGLMNGGYLGISDRDYISENEQRTAWRGIFSKLVSMRADEIAKALCQCQVKRKIDDNEFEDVEDGHPWKVLWEEPSQNSDRFELFEQLSKLRDIGRGAHLAIFRGQFQVPEKMEIIYPYFGEVRAQGNVIGGIEEFVFTSNGGQIVQIPRREMVWLKHSHPVTPFESSSLLMRGMYELDVNLFQAIYARDIAKEGNVPNVYISTDQHITSKQRQEFGREMTKNYRTAGVDNLKTLILGSGTRLETVAMSPDDMQAVQTANLNNNQLYIMTGFPPEMFAENGTLANSKEGRMKWLQNSIQNEVIKICSSLTHQLKIAFGAQESNLCIVPADVVPKDPLELQRIRETQLRTGQRTPNEFRMEDGMPEYPEGEFFFLGGGLRPASQVTAEPEPLDMDLEEPDNETEDSENEQD